jgi:hypothetical protein
MRRKCELTHVVTLNDPDAAKGLPECQCKSCGERIVSRMMFRNAPHNVRRGSAARGSGILIVLE